MNRYIIAMRAVIAAAAVFLGAHSFAGEDYAGQVGEEKEAKEEIVDDHDTEMKGDYLPERWDRPGQLIRTESAGRPYTEDEDICGKNSAEWVAEN